MSILLDTHVWLWWLTQSPKMRTRERQSLDRLAERELPYIAAISVWEAQMLVSRKRLIPSEAFDPWIRRMCASEVVRILPLDVDVVASLHA